MRIPNPNQFRDTVNRKLEVDQRLNDDVARGKLDEIFKDSDNGILHNVIVPRSCLKSLVSLLSVHNWVLDEHYSVQGGSRSDNAQLVFKIPQYSKIS